MRHCSNVSVLDVVGRLVKCPLLKRDENVTAACCKGPCPRGWSIAVGLSARSPVGRATVLRPRRRRSVLRLVDGVGDLDSEPSSGPILIVTVTVSRRP